MTDTDRISLIVEHIVNAAMFRVLASTKQDQPEHTKASEFHVGEANRLLTELFCPFHTD